VYEGHPLRQSLPKLAGAAHMGRAAAEGLIAVAHGNGCDMKVAAVTRREAHQRFAARAWSCCEMRVGAKAPSVGYGVEAQPLPKRFGWQLLPQ
jgi:hypothetical protein